MITKNKITTRNINLRVGKKNIWFSFAWNFLTFWLLEQEEEERFFKEALEKVQQFFNDLGIEIKEKYMKFGEWVTNTFKEGLEKGESELENIKAIANAVIVYK